MISQLKDAVRELVEGSLGLSRVSDELKVFSAWSRMASSRLTGNVSLEKFVSGTVYLSARNSAWAQQAHLMKQQIISSVNEAIGKRIVRDLRIVSGFSEELSETGIQPISTCAECGVEFKGRTALCPICSRHKRESTLRALFRLVDREPSVAFSRVKTLVPGATETDLKRVKRDLKELRIDRELTERRSRGGKKRKDI